MKKIMKVMIPSMLGSGLTIVVFLLTGLIRTNMPVTNHLQPQVPVHHALYTVKENGEFIPLDFTGISKQAMNSVVNIRSSVNAQPQTMPHNFRYQNPFGDMFGDDFFRYFWREPQPGESPQQQPAPYQRMATGSGVIISRDGYIVTNNHVVENASEIEVTLHDNGSYKAKVIGTDPSTDIALLKIKGEDLEAISLGNSDLVEVGQWVLAVGNPYNLNSTITAGIISAKGRNINIIDDQSAIEAFIQTDAAINPGNSGGALVNLNGELVGINTAIASPTGAYAGYGFAIPVNIVNKVVEDIMKYGMVQRAFLGVLIRDIDGNLIQDKHLKISEGVYVDSLTENSAATRAGIKTGDVITRVDDIPIRQSADLLEQIGRRRPGDEVNIVIDRKGKEMTFAVKLRDQEGNTKLVEKGDLDLFEILGAIFENIDKDTADRLGIDGGVRVKGLKNGLLKNETEISEGFIITGINHKKVTMVEDIRKSLKNYTGGVLIQGLYENYPGELYYAFGLPE